jgi:hypothetical protein
MFAMPILAVFQLIPFLWQMFVAMAVSTGVSLLLARKQKGAKPAGKEDFDLPTAEEGRPYPVLFGCRRIRSPNAVSPLIQLSVKAKKKRSGIGSKTTVAHYYSVGLHLGVCQANIDGIRQIWVADTCVWPVLNDPTSQASDGQTLATIAAGECFGGYKRKGNLRPGPHPVRPSDQTLDSYLSPYRRRSGRIGFHRRGSWPWSTSDLPQINPGASCKRRIRSRRSRCVHQQGRGRFRGRPQRDPHLYDC